MSREQSTLVERVLSLRRACVYATVALTLSVLVEAVGISTRHGLVDGFGHIIGNDVLCARVAAEIVRAGDGDRLYDFRLQTARWRTAIAKATMDAMLPAGKGKGITQFIQPPFVALAYLPLTMLPYFAGFAVWTAIEIACLIAAIAVLGKAAPEARAHRGAAVLLALSFAPIFRGLAVGSNSIVVLPIFAGAFIAMRWRHDVLAGALLALALFRPHLLLAPLLLLLWKRRWRTIGGFLAIAALLSLFSVAFVGTHALLAWLELVPFASRMIFEPGGPSVVSGSVHSLFLLPLGPRHLALGLAAGSAVVIGLLAMLATLWKGPWRPESDDFSLQFAALLIVTPLTSHYLLLHDLALLVLAAVLLVDATVRRPQLLSPNRLKLALAVTWVTCMISPALVTRVVSVPVAPIGALVLGWAVFRAARGAIDEEARIGEAASSPVAIP